MKIDEVNRAVDAYMDEAEGSAAARMRFLGGVWDIQSAIEVHVPPYVAPDAATAEEALATSQPLFLVASPEINSDAYRAAVDQLARYVVENAGLAKDEAEALEQADFVGALTDELITSIPRDFESFVASVSASLGADTETTSLSGATIAFILASALVPFLARASEVALDALGDFQWSIWGSGACPVCGSAAALGRMSEGSAQQGASRTLWCSTCHAEWGYDRIRCVRCGSRKQDQLRYTYEESDPAHRLHLCDECHGYLKVTFENETDKPISMVVEEAASMTLDAIARANGYTPAGDATDA